MYFGTFPQYMHFHWLIKVHLICMSATHKYLNRDLSAAIPLILERTRFDQSARLRAAVMHREAFVSSVGVVLSGRRGSFCSQRYRPIPLYRKSEKISMAHELSSVKAIEWFKSPVTVGGPVQRGFGRGSKDLGTPTANLPGKLAEDVPDLARDGVYLGFGCVPKYGSKVVKMAANLGRNITYGDVPERVLEAYLMFKFDDDFYGEEMRLCIIGYLRPELKFDSLDELTLHIQNDIKVSESALDLPRAVEFGKHKFLTA